MYSTTNKNKQKLHTTTDSQNSFVLADLTMHTHCACSCKVPHMKENENILKTTWLRLFLGGGSVVVDLLFNLLSIVCGSSVFVFVLRCITLCSF